MRVLWKLSLIVGIGVLIQGGLARGANDIDEAAFVVRVLCATSTGMRYDDPELLDAATRLLRRQCKRMGATLPSEVERDPLLTVSACDL